MQYFTGLEYLYIDIANQYGFDKSSWNDRITWVHKTEANQAQGLEKQTNFADNPILYTKAVKVLRDTQAGKWTGFIMGLDATASGLQIMAALTGCHDTARMVNLIDTGKREDVYLNLANEMSIITNTTIDRSHMKAPVMTTFYGSKAQPRKIFGSNTPELAAFYKSLDTHLPGAMELMNDFLALQDKWQSIFKWTLPDGHKVVYKIYTPKDRVFRIPAINNSSYTYRHYINAPDPGNRSLAANIVHSIDGYIVREMLRRAHKKSVQVATIHDSFWCHPNDMDLIRYNYKEILAEIADANLLDSIFPEVTNNPRIRFRKLSHTLGTEIRKSNYALS